LCLSWNTALSVRNLRRTVNKVYQCRNYRKRSKDRISNESVRLLKERIAGLIKPNPAILLFNRERLVELVESFST
jgi:hypothetical protein